LTLRFIKKFAPSFTHALGHLDRRIDCPRYFAGFCIGGFYGRAIARMLTDMAHGFGLG
jgi:hypothetical protein